MTTSALPKVAIVFETILGIGAIGGGLALVIGPRGEVLPLPVSALAGSPFTTYCVPGLILVVVLGVGPLVAAVLAHRRHAAAPFFTVVVGAALVIWIAVEIAIVGYSSHPPLQAVYLGLGIVIVLVGGMWTFTDPSARRRLGFA